MKNILFILFLFFLFSCSENNNKQYIEYTLHFNYLTNQIDKKIEEALQQTLDKSNDLLRGNPQKLGPYIKIIKKVNSKSDSLFDMIEAVKLNILDLHNLNNTNLENLKGSKTKLSVIEIDQIIEGLKEYEVELKAIIKNIENDEQFNKHIKNTLDTDRIAKLTALNSSSSKSSELYAILSMLQYRVKLIQSTVVHRIHNQFSFSCSWWFVNLDATVIPKAKEIYLGDTFEAEIFLAAWDTTSSPRVIIGDQVLKVYEGKAYYKKLITSKDTGIITEPGKILILRPGSSVIDSVPFTIEYKIIK